mmetsp:Transcript_78454/g.240038  ORF Transcript_78454/g.240038 Transcript_78454/m.240038 type:complete len:90 (-) Transcript_78454:62-331(-)
MCNGALNLRSFLAEFAASSTGQIPRRRLPVVQLAAVPEEDSLPGARRHSKVSFSHDDEVVEGPPTPSAPTVDAMAFDDSGEEDGAARAR